MMRIEQKDKRTADRALTIGVVLFVSLIIGMWTYEWLRGKEERMEVLPTNEEYWTFMNENDGDLRWEYEAEVYSLLRAVPRPEIYAQIEQVVERWADETEVEIGEVGVDIRRSLETLWRDDGNVTNQNLFNDYETVVQVVCLEAPYYVVADEVIDALEYDIYGKYMLQSVEVQVYTSDDRAEPVYTDYEEYPPVAWEFDRNIDHSDEEAARTVAYDYAAKLDETYFAEHVEKRAHQAATFGLSHFGINEDGDLYVGMRAAFEPEGEYSAQFMEALEENVRGMADALTGDERTAGWLNTENVGTMIVEVYLDWLGESQAFTFEIGK